MTAENRAPPARSIIREAEVAKRCGKSRVQRWRDMKKGLFPAPVQIGENSVGWYEDEINDWVATRPRVTYDKPDVTKKKRGRGR